MALNTVTVPSPTIRTFAFGSNASQTQRFTSTTSLNLKTIQVRVAPYVENASVEPTASNQIYAYSTKYPSFPSSVSMPALGTLPRSARHYSIYLTRIDEFTFDITVRWLFLADRDGFPTGAIYNNLHHFEKNNVGAVNDLDNSAPSVYNQVNTMRVEATVWDGMTAENAVFDQTYLARYLCETGGCCEELDSCLNIPILSWTMQLERGGVPVTNFSAYENTKVKWTAQLAAGASISKYWILIYRRDDYSNTYEYWNDLNLNYALVQGASLISVPFTPFDTTAFVSATDFTLLSGDIYEAQIEINKDFFELGGSYRVMIVAEDNGTSEQYSCTHDRAILANDLPDPISGDTSNSIWIHDANSTEYTNDCVINLATRQRIRIDCLMDKVSYNDNLFNEGFLTDFDTNLISKDVVILDHLPDDKEILNGGELSLINFQPDVNTDGSRVIFRVPENWSGVIRYIIFIWKFQVTNGDGFTWNDEIRKPVKLVMSTNDEVGANDFTPELTNDSAEVVETRICDDYDDPLNICWSEALPDDYDFIPLIQEGTPTNEFEEFKEFNSFNNTALNQETTEEYLSSEDDTSVDGEACAICGFCGSCGICGTLAIF